MPPTHHWPVNLSEGLGTVAHWSTSNPRRLVVFVHGFRGSAVKTWIQFPAMMEKDPALGDCDFIFYGYDSPKYRVPVSGYRLYQFLDRACGDSGVLADESLPPSAACRGLGNTYDAIVLVAHSLGAVIARQALILAHEHQRLWADRVRLVLFAPAHKGSDVVSMAGTFLGVFKPLSPELFEAGLELVWPVLKDLKEGSPTLAQLEAKVLAAVPAGDDPHCLKAYKVMHGTEDPIVSPLDFGRDPSPEFIEGRYHINVCKPDESYDRPVQTVLEALR